MRGNSLRDAELELQWEKLWTKISYLTLVVFLVMYAFVSFVLFARPTVNQSFD